MLSIRKTTVVLYQLRERNDRRTVTAMKLEKAMRRERKQQRRSKHVTDSRSVFTIEDEQKKRALKIKRQRELKELARET